MRVLSDSWPVPGDDAENVLLCLHRDRWVSGAEYRDGRVTWVLWDDCPRGEESCRHLVLKQRIAKVVSAHTVDAWQ